MTTIKPSTIKPGLLVSLHTSIRGAVNYERRTLEAEHVADDGAQRAKWETLREIPDPAEFQRATLARSAARGAIAKNCIASAFGLLCPTSREAELEAAILEARAIAARFNAAATRARLDVFVLVGRIAQDDVEATRAIGAEVRELMEDMQRGISSADPEQIREAASKARAIGQMLAPDVGAKVSLAITQAREAARAIVQRVQKSGEAAAVVVAELQTEKIAAARFAFLDMDDAAPAEAVAPAAAALDLPPESAPAIDAAPARPATLELF